ncbi:MAG TPA: AraC family transcriptional regulator [Dokdonella sp.]|nr:AraC family transcriptional regulator [Dokdonella sp.]
MDALSDVLKSVRLEGAVFISATFTEPWCIWSQFGSPVVLDKLARYEHAFYFHFVVEGACQVRVLDGGEVISAAAGDFILFAHDERHVVGSDVRLLPVESASLEDANVSDGVLELRHGGGGKVARFVCGYIGCSRSLNRALFDALPRVMRIPVGDGPTAALLGDLLRIAVRESARRGPGSESILAKLTELVFVEALRGYVAALPAQSKGWLAALRDPHVGRALALLHGDPGRPWSLDELARDVALSKSALAQRFASLVGVSPMRYLHRWRLTLAARELRDGAGPIVRIAAASGYESEAAFNRAFRREFGMPPATWRKTATAGAIEGRVDAS